MWKEQWSENFENPDIRRQYNFIPTVHMTILLLWGCFLEFPVVSTSFFFPDVSPKMSEKTQDTNAQEYRAIK